MISFANTWRNDNKIRIIGISYAGSAESVVTFRQCNAFLHCPETQNRPKTFKAIRQEIVNQ